MNTFLEKLKQPKVFFSLLAVLGIGAIFWTSQQPSQYEGFVDCLDRNNVTYYGAFWCPNCAQQSQRFGGSSVVSDVYVECSTPDRQGQTAICRAQNIQSYPTWEFGDGERITGVQPLETLAQRSGCQLPA